METQEISAPVERLTREAPKRQAGYGLPCAKCHKYFPADLEVCPICKGRERVSPVVAPKIKKPVQSETSVAASSTNVALKQDINESPKSESPALVQPIEIKVKDRLLDSKDSIPTPVVAKLPADSEPGRASLVSTQTVLTQKEKESPKLKSPAVAAPVEVKVKDQPLNKKEPVKSPAVAELPPAAEPAPASFASTQKAKQSQKLEFSIVAPPVEINAKDEPLDHKESITTPVIAEIPADVEQAPASLVSTQPVLTRKEKQSPKSESPTSAPPIEIKAMEQPLEKKESITTPVVVEIPVAAESARASLVSTQLVVSQKEKESPKLEFPVVAPPVEIDAKEQPLEKKEPIATLVVAEIQAAAEPAHASLVSTQKEKEKKSPKSESPALAPPVEIKMKDQPLEQKESTAVPVVQLPAAVEPPLASLISTQKANESPKLDSPAVRCLSDQPNNDRPNQEEPIAPPALVEAQASDPVPATVAPMPEEKVRTIELEPVATVLPTQLDTEEQRRDKINQALRIVIPMLVETQVSGSAPVAAKQEVLEQKKKEQAPKMSEAPMSAAEVKVVETKTIEVKTAALPAVVDQANHRPVPEKSRPIDKSSDAPPKPVNVNAPVVVHVNLGELRAAKSTSERAPAQLKEIEQTEPESSSSDISSDADTSESPAPVGGRKLDFVTFALGVVVLACAVLLITLAAIRLMPHHASEPVHRAKPAYSSAPTADQNTNAAIPTPPPIAPNSASSDSSPVVAPAAALVQPPAPSASSQSSSAGLGQVLTLPEGLAEGNLLYRVEPDYPEEARRQGVQGPVVLDLHIGKDGLVQGVDLVSGQPLLAQAATAAVKQWRFRTRYVNGNEVEMQARITLHFALPTP
jgi:TonB family protein